MAHDEAQAFVNDNLPALCREVIDLKNGERTGPHLVQLQQLVPRVGSALLLAISYVSDAAIQFTYDNYQ